MIYHVLTQRLNDFTISGQKLKRCNIGIRFPQAEGLLQKGNERWLLPEFGI